MKCGPDECPIVTFSDLTPAEQRVERKRVAEKMTKQGFTQEQIAKQLGVSRETITKDLAGLVIDTKPPRPKGGRPKGSRPRRTTDDEDRLIASKILDEGKTHEEVQAERGVSNTVIRRAVAKEEGRREISADPPIDRSMLPISAQQKFDAAIRQYKKKLGEEFNKAVNDEVARRIDEIILPDFRKQIEDAENLYYKRHGIMDKITFNMIRRALHPDSRNSISDSKLAEAFDAFMALEKYLLNEKESPTVFPSLPSNLAEWEKMRAATKTKRSRSATNAVRKQGVFA